MTDYRGREPYTGESDPLPILNLYTCGLALLSWIAVGVVAIALGVAFGLVRW